MSFEFGGSLYNSLTEYTYTFCWNWVYAGRNNNENDAKEYFDALSNDEIYAEMMTEWSDEEGVDKADFLKALQELREEVAAIAS